MSFNTFGKIFRFTTWGESHGPAIGCVVDGCPPNIPLSEKDIQTDMNRRRPGKSKFTSQRKELDRVEILSGIFQGKTTGTPISMIIYNEGDFFSAGANLGEALFLGNIGLETEVVSQQSFNGPSLEYFSTIH